MYVSTTDGVPSRHENSTIKCVGGLAAHPERELEDELAPRLFKNNRPLPEPKGL
jgi:hypothetical protein